MKIFASEAKLNAHIGVDHEKQVKCPDCDETFAKATVLGRHRQLEHGYVSPRYAARKAAEAKRQAVVDTVMAEEEASAARFEDDRIPQGQILKNDEAWVEDIAAFGKSFEESRNFETGIAEPQVIGTINETGGLISNSQGVYAYGKLNAGVKTSDISLVRGGSGIVGGSIYAEPEVEHVDFLDERDSWTMSLDALTNQGVHDLRRTLEAAGLKMEIRVWRE